MAYPPKKKINKGLIVLNKGERTAVITLLSLIALLLAFSLFRPVLRLSRQDRQAFHNLDSMIASHQVKAPVSTTSSSGSKAAESYHNDPLKTTRSASQSSAYKASTTAPSAYKSTASKATVSQSSTSQAPPPVSVPVHTSKASPPKPLALNRADSTELIALPQIGEVMASRIHRYRDRLGGYVSMDQLFEVKGMDSARYATIEPYLTLDSKEIRHLNVNQDEFKTLLRHPYLEYEQVKAIVNYRERKGQLRDWKQVRELIGEVNPLLESYLTY